VALVGFRNVAIRLAAARTATLTCGETPGPPERRPLNSKAKPIATPCKARERQKGFESSTFGLGSNRPHYASIDSKTLTPTLPAACTAACTSEAETTNAGNLDADQGDPLVKLAAELAKLSLADRERLAAMPTGR
jgi:hypothetical protein